MMGLGLGGLGLAEAGRRALSWRAYAASAIPPVLVLDIESAIYGDNQVWWAEAPAQPADAIVFADVENGRYAA